MLSEALHAMDPVIQKRLPDLPDLGKELEKAAAEAKEQGSPSK